MTEEQSSAVHIQALVWADGILLVISSKLQLLFINLASVPGRQLVNAPTAAILDRYLQADPATVHLLNLLPSMSEKGSVFQKGGGGTNFEQAIQSAFLTTLIIRGNAPLNFANEIVEVAFQTTNRGYETDDLLVLAKSAIGQHRLLVQIKNNITFTADNTLFKEVIKAFWKDYNNTTLLIKRKTG